MQQTEIYEACAAYAPFPDASDVFAGEEQNWLLPLGVVAFKAFDSKAHDKILIALPIEPQDDYLGAATRDFHNETCREN